MVYFTLVSRYILFTWQSFRCLCISLSLKPSLELYEYPIYLILVRCLLFGNHTDATMFAPWVEVYSAGFYRSHFRFDSLTLIKRPLPASYRLLGPTMLTYLRTIYIAGLGSHGCIQTMSYFTLPISYTTPRAKRDPRRSERRTYLVDNDSYSVTDLCESRCSFVYLSYNCARFFLLSIIYPFYQADNERETVKKEWCSIEIWRMLIQTAVRVNRRRLIVD